MSSARRYIIRADVIGVLMAALHARLVLRDGSVLVGRITRHLAPHGRGTVAIRPIGVGEPVTVDAEVVTTAATTIGMTYEQRQRIAREQAERFAPREQEARI